MLSLTVWKDAKPVIMTSLAQFVQEKIEGQMIVCKFYFIKIRCTSGFYQIEGMDDCQACDSNCVSCSGSSDNCISCDGGNRKLGSCECIDAHYDNPDDLSADCLLCPDHCAACVSKYACTLCDDPNRDANNLCQYLYI